MKTRDVANAGFIVGRVILSCLDSPLAGRQLEDAGLLIAKRTLEHYLAGRDYPG